LNRLVLVAVLNRKRWYRLRMTLERELGLAWHSGGIRRGLDEQLLDRNRGLGPLGAVSRIARGLWARLSWRGNLCSFGMGFCSMTLWFGGVRPGKITGHTAPGGRKFLSPHLQRDKSFERSMIRTLEERVYGI
jgi:hypothetical protein